MRVLRIVAFLATLFCWFILPLYGLRAAAFWGGVLAFVVLSVIRRQDRRVSCRAVERPNS